jgi:hypothetical protein
MVMAQILSRSGNVQDDQAGKWSDFKSVLMVDVQKAIDDLPAKYSQGMSNVSF